MPTPTPPANPGQYTKFYGQIESMPAGLIGDWVISGRVVRTTAATRFKQEYGAFQVGAWVEVEGYAQADGSINATKIETKSRSGSDDGDHSGQEVKFYGTVTSIPASYYGTWTIGQYQVQVTPATKIKQEHGPVQVGSYVKVEAIRQADGSLWAKEIESK